MTKRKDILEFLNEDCIQNSLSYGMLSALLEYWAAEKDYELKNQLLNTLVIKYAESIGKLAELNQLKNQFLGMAAHDLRNPLVSIRGLSEIILTEATGPLTQAQREYLTIINTVSNSMLALVNNLLDISIIESGKLDLRLEKGFLEKTIKERIRIHRVLAEEKRIALHEDLAKIPPQSYDHSRLIQVIDNLLSNAIKFSHPGTNVYVTLEEIEGMARVGVRDEGPGIAEEDQSRLFGEFQKLRIEPTGGERSTGLGLAIVKKIVEAHRGALRVQSQVGLGSMFSFDIPLENGDVEDEKA
jgi:two-component system sensor histidine kinase/response regulator